tara:strand:+ start:2315 stop:2482 length:168 start_codon:yes stop_codon:yes gene_type:complete
MPLDETGDILENAYNFTTGVGMGIAVAFIPVLAVTIGVGLAMRIAKKGFALGVGE